MEMNRAVMENRAMVVERWECWAVNSLILLVTSSVTCTCRWFATLDILFPEFMRVAGGCIGGVETATKSTKTSLK